MNQQQCFTTQINKDTKMCISLSSKPGNFGTRFHNFLYQKLELDFIYKAFSTTNICEAISGMRALGIRGCSISMPFKEKCIEYVNELDESARGIASVNTVVNQEGHLKAYNTDYTAVLQLLKSHNVSPTLNFAVLGSGGMAKAVVCALRNTGFNNGIIVARNKTVGTALAHQYGFSWQPELISDQPAFIINTTPIGMMGTQIAHELPFSKSIIESSQVVFDVIANPSQTPLIQHAKKLHKQIISGADVIVLQAVEQFVLYTGIRPAPELIESAAQYALNQTPTEK